MFNIQNNKRGRKTNPALTNGLISYWKLNEVSGTRLDSIGANHLTDNNTVGSTAGKIDNCAAFVAANSEYLSIASNASLQVGDFNFTIAGWFYLSSKTTEGTVVSKYLTTGNQRQWIIFYDQPLDRMRVSVSPNGITTTEVTANAFGSPSIGTWYFFCFWHDATANTINIQINNGTVNSAAYSTGVFATGTGAFVIGNVSNLILPYFDGRVDEVGFWKKLLSTSERTSLYSNGLGSTYPFAI